MVVRHDPLSVAWMGYATARIEASDGTVVYTDPGRYDVLEGRRPEDGDLVLVTHGHHYDPDGIDRVAGADAVVIVHEAVDAATIARDVVPVESLPLEVVRAAAGEQVTVLDAEIEVEVTPAHNLASDGERVSHPPGMGCGYRFVVDDRAIFWPGDTDPLEAFFELDVSLLLANIGGGSATDRHAAAELAERLDPDLVVPIHYDTFESLEADSSAFAADVAARSIPVALDEGSPT